MILRTILLLAAMLPALICAQAKSSKADVKVEFDSTSFDFGTVSQDSGPVTHVFEMTNTGDEAVAILSASTTCGCTRPEFPKKPVKPGGKAKIKVSFLPEGQKGEVSRDIKLKLKSAGGKNRRMVLKIHGVVLPAHK